MLGRHLGKESLRKGVLRPPGGGHRCRQALLAHRRRGLGDAIVWCAVLGVWRAKPTACCYGTSLSCWPITWGDPGGAAAWVIGPGGYLWVLVDGQFDAMAGAGEGILEDSYDDVVTGRVPLEVPGAPP